ncbi:MAG: GNAT family N-acetyltransferase [Sphaerobacter sp.]|nr:GNAT family N-acetyltransferase [Sphaerobacter sp.]
MVVLRNYEPGDLVQISRLRAAVYSRHDDERLEWHASVWHWLESHPLAPEHLHRWVLADGDRVVGFLGAVPQYYRIRGKRVVAHTPTDYMVDPAYGFHAVSLMRAFFRNVENCVSVDWLPSVIRVQTWLGATQVTHLRYAAKILTTAKLPVSLPGPLDGGVNLALRAADRLLTVGRKGVTVKVLDSFDERFDRFFESLTVRIACLAEKDAAFLQWRYGPSSPQPAGPLLGAFEGDELVGYAVLRVTATDRSGYIMDLTALPGRHDVAAALLRASIWHLREMGAHLIRYRFLLSSLAPLPRDLWRLGFFTRKQTHTLQVKFADPEFQLVATNPLSWAYSAGDGELSFWVE